MIIRSRPTISIFGKGHRLDVLYPDTPQGKSEIVGR